MVKKIILVIVLFVTVGVIGGMSFLNYKFDNSVENENVLDIGKLQNKVGNTLKQEVNEIKDVNDKIRMYKKRNIKMYKNVQC